MLDSTASQGLSRNNWSHENTMKDRMFLMYPLEAFYLNGHTAFNIDSDEILATYHNVEKSNVECVKLIIHG